jgi:hypothetical protein
MTGARLHRMFPAAEHVRRNQGKVMLFGLALVALGMGVAMLAGRTHGN